jgi:hypothetical protein
VTVGDFEYRGSNSGLRSRWPPVVAQVSVRATNVSAHPALLDVLGGNCAVRLRIYASHAGTGPAGPVFDATQQGFECYVPLLRRPLAPGQSITLQSAADGPGLNLRPGRYDLAGVITVVPPPDSLRHHGAHRVEVPAGSIRVPEPYD